MVDDQAYFACPVCEAKFLDPASYPSAATEKQHYDRHQNEVDDPAYRRFLSRLFEPMTAVIPAGSEGLDYGCGPGPALSAMFSEAGFKMAVYDPFYADHAEVLTRTYDFISCSETAEHFHNPAAEFARFDRLLRPGGLLGLMTCFQTEDDTFADWHYRKDPTHVVFYREATVRFIANQLGFTCDVPRKDVALLRKPER